MSAAHRWTRAQMLGLADRAVAKIDMLGPRGTTLVSMEEIAALAGTVVLLRAELADFTNAANRKET